MLIPLRQNQKLLGLFGLVRYQAQQPEFEKADLQLGQEIADRCALAFSNLRLYQQLQEANGVLEQRVAERTTALAQANQQLERQARWALQLAQMTQQVSEIGPVSEPVYEVIARNMAEATQGGSILLLYQPERQVLQIVSTYHQNPLRRLNLAICSKAPRSR